MSYLPVFTVLNLERSKVYVTKLYIHVYCFFSLLYFKSDINLWTNREAICESQCSRGRPSIILLLKSCILRAPTAPITCPCAKGKYYVCTFFPPILRLINTANAIAQVDVFQNFTR